MKICINCGSEYFGKGNKYCTYKCQQDFQYKERVKIWLNGGHNGVKGKNSTCRWIKKYLINTNGEKCSKCGWCEFTNNIPIELEHIDGDFTNNDINNLILLCPNCHSLTSTYKGANRGSGRPR